MLTFFISAFLIAGGTLSLMTTIDRKKMKEVGENWFKFIIEDLSFQDEEPKITIDENGVKHYTYAQPFDYYTFIQSGTSWQVKCTWTTNKYAYYTFMYDPKEERVTKENYTARNMTGIHGYFALQQEKIDRALSTILRKAIDQIKEIEKDDYERAADKIKEDAFFWIDGEDGIEFVTDKYTKYIHKEGERTETFESYWADKLIYRVVRHKKSKFVLTLYIEPDYLKDVKDADDFARKQEIIWQEMKHAIQRNQQKEEKIRAIWEGKDLVAEKDKWMEQVKELHKRRMESKKHNNYLTEDELLYLHKSLIGDLNEIALKLHRNEISHEKAQLFFAYIDKRLSEIEQSIQKKKEETVKITVKNEIDG